MAFYTTSKFLFGLIKGVGYINSYFEGDFQKGRTQLIVAALHMESGDTAITGYEQ